VTLVDCVTDRDGPGVARWGGSLFVVLALHAALLMVLLSPPIAVETAGEPPAAVMLDLAPGDVAIFGCFTPHRSAPNLTSRWRRQLYLSYTARRDGGDLREQHYRRFHAWLRQKYAASGKTDLYFR